MTNDAQQSANPTPNCGGRFARRRSLARAAVNVGLSNWHVKRVTVTVRAKARATEEPDAGKPHVRLCGGGSG
jgi:hypothetical protein